MNKKVLKRIRHIVDIYIKKNRVTGKRSLTMQSDSIIHEIYHSIPEKHLSFASVSSELEELVP